MIQVADRIYVGGQSDCQRGTEGLVIVHACKDPCHKRAVGYQDNLARHHPKFLVKEDPFDLYLNIIDPREPRFQIDTFIEFLRFAMKHYNKGSSILIHCNMGASRSPSLALLFLAKYLGKLPDDTFGTARAAFKLIYPGYQPGPGIYKYFTDNWQSLGDF